MSRYLISLMVFLPFLGALAQTIFSFTKRGEPGRFSSWIGLGSSLASALCGIVIVVGMETGQAGLQAIENLPWIRTFSITYSMGMDGMNVLLVLLISLVSPLLIGMDWQIASGWRGMTGLLLLIQGSLLGAACSQDLFLLFFFWSLSALPFYFLVGIWGGSRRESSAFRSIVSASIGNAFFFLALVLIYYSSDPHSFSLQTLGAGGLTGKTFTLFETEISVPMVLVSLLCTALAFRIPIWPLHGWFSDFADEAPPIAFVALTSLLVPVGIGIFFRLICFLFPETVPFVAEGLFFVGMINLLVGVTIASTQKNLRQLWAFLCMSEVGLCFIGLGSLSLAGTIGSIYLLLSSGLSLAGFGIFCGLLLRKKEGGQWGGWAEPAPKMAFVSALMIISLLGFPGMGGFVGRSLILIGSFPLHTVAVVFICIAFVVAAYYLLNLYKNVFMGEPPKGGSNPGDLTSKELVCFLPILLSLLFLGLYPKPLLDLVRPTVQSLQIGLR